MKKKKPDHNRKKQQKRQSNVSFDTMHFDFEDLLELDEEKEFLRDDADEVEDEPDEEPEEDPIEDLTDSPVAERYPASGKRRKAVKSGEEEDLLTDEQVLEYTQEIGKIPEGIEDLEEEDEPAETAEYDAYEDRHTRGRSRDDEDQDEDDEYDEEDDYDEEDEDDAYEDEDIDEDEDEDEDDEESSRRKFSLNAFEMVAIAMSAVLVLAAISLVMMFARSRRQNERMDAFLSVGGQMEGVRIIGESGLLAMRDAAALRLAEASMVEEPEPEEEEEQEIVVETPEVTAEIVTVDLTLTTIKKDIKIKFINAKTEKLIASVPFTVTVKDPNGKETDWSDDDKDGVIHKTDVGAGTWKVTLKPLMDEYAEKYAISDKTKTVKVKDTIAYKKVDVTNEIKKESQVNIAKEDTEPKEATVVESENKDTVEWVESRKEEIGEEEDFEYSETGKDTIKEPTIASLNPYRRLRIGRGAAAGAIIELTEGQTSERDIAQSVASLGESFTVTSDDGSIASVESVNGTKVTIRAVKAGDTRLTVTSADNGRTDYVIISVKAAENTSSDSGSGSGATDPAAASTTDASTGASSTGATESESGSSASKAGSTADAGSSAASSAWSS